MLVYVFDVSTLFLDVALLKFTFLPPSILEKTLANVTPKSTFGISTIDTLRERSFIDISARRSFIKNS